MGWAKCKVCGYTLGREHSQSHCKAYGEGLAAGRAEWKTVADLNLELVATISTLQKQLEDAPKIRASRIPGGFAFFQPSPDNAELFALVALSEEEGQDG